MTHDVETNNQGSIVLVRPVSEAAKAWIDENVADNGGLLWWAGALAVGHQYVCELIEGMVNDGLIVVDEPTGRVATMAGRG